MPTRLNMDLIKAARASLRKQGFVPADQQGMTPVDPNAAAAGGMPPQGAPMPQGAPPMDPAMAGGAPAPGGGMPQDPAALGGGPGQAPLISVSLDDLMQLFAQVSGQGAGGSGGAPGGEGGKNESPKPKGGKANLEAEFQELNKKFDMLLQTLGVQPGLVPIQGGGGGGGDAAAMGAPSGMTPDQVPTPEVPGMPGMEENALAPQGAAPAPAQPGMTVQASEQPKDEPVKPKAPAALKPLPPEKPADPNLRARTQNQTPVSAESMPKEGASQALTLHRVMQNLLKGR